MNPIIYIYQPLISYANIIYSSYYYFYKSLNHLYFILPSLSPIYSFIWCNDLIYGFFMHFDHFPFFVLVTCLFWSMTEVGIVLNAFEEDFERV